MFIQFNNRTSKLLNLNVNGQGYFEVTSVGKAVTVKILNMSEETEGGYSCTGLHYFGQADLEGPTSWVHLAVSPEITHQRLVYADEFGEVNLTSSFTGLPLPNVAIYRNGIELVSSNETDHLLYRLTGVEKSDAGSYIIRATNMAGQTESVIQLIVQYKPTILTVSSLRKHKVSSKVSFLCEVDSNPDSEIQWLHNNTELRNQSGEVSILGDGRLIVHNLAKNHSGAFTCRASNRLGHDKKDFPLIVQVPPGAPGRPEIISYTQTTARLRWKAGFSGYSEIIAYKVQYQNTTTKGWQHFVGLKWNSSVENEIEDLRANANYRFRLRAINDVDHGSWSEPSESIVTYPLAPPKPERPATENVKSTEFVFYWEPPLHYVANDIYGTIRGYKVEYWVTSDQKTTRQYVNVTKDSNPLSANEVKLTRLRKGTQYTVIVSAYNRAYIGVSSVEETVMTLKTTPAAPTDVEAKAITSQSIRLSWTNPADNGGGTVSGVIVQCRVVGESEWKDIDQQPKVGANSVVVSDLSEKMRYVCQVRLVNEIGQGQAGVSNSITTPAKKSPEQPDLKITSVEITTVSLAWSETGSNPVLSWELEVKQGESEKWNTLRDSLSESEKNINITELSPNTTYWFRVAASNSFGLSPYSVVVGATTKPIEPPPPVSSITVVQRSDNTGYTVMTWEGLNQDGITGYIVQYRHTDSTEWIEELVGPDEEYFVFRELQHNSTYHFRIITLKGDVRSSPSNISQFKTQEESPPLKVGELGDNSLPLFALITIGVVGGLIVLLLIIVLCRFYQGRRREKKRNSNDWYDPPEETTSWCHAEDYPGSQPPSSSRAVTQDIQYVELQFTPAQSTRIPRNRENTPFADIDIPETVARAERSPSPEPAARTFQRNGRHVFASTDAHPESDV
jgi:hypothetical protein